MVKQIKKFIYSTIKNNVLKFKDFEFLIIQATHMINKRPVAFKDELRNDFDNVPNVITPELLIHGYELVTVNIIPELQSSESDPDYLPGNNQSYDDYLTKFKNCRQRLIEIYHSQFLTNLIYQATNDKSRFKPIKHDSLSPGDIVLLKEINSKPQFYPMGIIKSVELNSLGESTSAVVLKGKTGELTKRHSTNLIPLLTTNEINNNQADQLVSEPNSKVTNLRKSKRLASKVATDKIADLACANLT